MRPRIQLLGLVALLLFPVSGVRADLLTNGDFSSWSGPTQPTGWIVEDTSKARIEQSADTVRSPSFAVRITRKVAGTGSNKGIKQLVPVSPNQGYTLTAWYLDNDINAAGGIGISWRDADTNYISHSGTFYTDSSIHTWQRLIKADTSPPNAAYGDVLLRVYGFSGSPAGGVVYADDAAFSLGCGIAQGIPRSLRSQTRLAAEPNPSPGPTTISLELPRPARVRLDVYDMTGSLRSTIHSGSMLSGRHAITWDGSDLTGQKLPSGLYFAVLSDTTGNLVVCKLVMKR